MRAHLMVLAMVAASTTLISGAAAQVQGVCVSGCNIPAPTPTQPQGPQLDPRLIVVGVSAEVRGDVTFVYPNGQRVRASAGTPIVFGARVETGAGAQVSFMLFDETLFTIGPIAEITIDRFVYDPTHADVSLRIVRGQFHWVSGHAARKPPGQININTPLMVLGIRGTDLEIEVNQDGSGFVALHEGVVDVEEFDSNRPFELHAGQTIRVANFQIESVN